MDILNLAFDDNEAGDKLRKQIPFLTVYDIEHTGIGLYADIKHDSGIEEFRVELDPPQIPEPKASIIKRLLKKFREKSKPKVIPPKTGSARLNEIRIENEAKGIRAEATVHIEEGLIVCIEIYNFIGEDYPLTEPDTYTIFQNWLPDDQRMTIVRGPSD